MRWIEYYPGVDRIHIGGSGGEARALARQRKGAVLSTGAVRFSTKTVMRACRSIGH